MNSKEFVFWLEGFIHGKNILDRTDINIIENKIKCICDITYIKANPIELEETPLDHYPFWLQDTKE